MTRLMQVCLVGALVLAPLSAESADLVVWWEKGFYPQVDEAIREIIAAFEQKTGKQVELVQPTRDGLVDQLGAALAAGHLPDFLYSSVSDRWLARWAYEDRLVELEGTLRPVLDLFDDDAIEVSTLPDGKTGRRGLYALPMGRGSIHVHVWNNLLERAGFTLTDVPKEWEAFWSFWCDQVQPAVRRATGRDVWGVGLQMSVSAGDTDDDFFQFQLAYEAPWLTRDRHLQVDDPKVRQGIIKALDAYTMIWRKGCTPPDSVSWGEFDNNKAFLTLTVVMTVQSSLSIPGALRTARPDDYYKNAATIDWPEDAYGQPCYHGLSIAGRGPEGQASCPRHRFRALPRRGRLACALAHLRR
jgi:multiple sugar transport system substrate-binding protein